MNFTKHLFWKAAEKGKEARDLARSIQFLDSHWKIRLIGLHRRTCKLVDVMVRSDTVPQPRTIINFRVYMAARPMLLL